MGCPARGAPPVTTGALVLGAGACGYRCDDLDRRLGFRNRSFDTVAGAGLALPSSGCLQVRLRTGGERIQLPGRVGRRSLKKLLQQQRVAPWLRQQLPLLYDGERLLAVADLWIAEGHAAAPGAPGLRLSWAPRDVPLTVSAQLSQVGDF